MSYSNFEVSIATLTYLHKIAKECAPISLPLTRCISYRLLECSGRRGVGDKHLTKCETCGIAWDPSSVKIRTKPRLLLRRSIRKLLAKERHRPWLLNSRQKKLLKRFNRATTMLVYLCKMCGKKQEQACPKPLRNQTSTANSTFFCRKEMGAKSTKRPISSPLHVLVKKKKKEKWTVSDPPKECASVKRNRSLLKRVLIEQDTQKTSSGGLHSFLSSL
ncbi:uncharacterized protein LOC119176319 [Rhipicephalus microplus]|uniref:uncharacterized protein LOC119176319 n=1 Tax=Rhipicephalus microplus TaxID=6941 RepID=UPI0018888530|nr:UPF0711 protein C18orf21-like [Rhipicephalus microplus]